jgi:hypothetical protein
MQNKIVSKTKTDILEEIKKITLKIESLINFPQCSLEEKKYLNEYSKEVLNLFKIKIGEDIFPSQLDIVARTMFYLDIEETFSAKYFKFDKIFGIKKYKIKLYEVSSHHYFYYNSYSKVELYPDLEWSLFQLNKYLDSLISLETEIKKKNYKFFKEQQI